MRGRLELPTQTLSGSAVLPELPAPNINFVPGRTRTDNHPLRKQALIQSSFRNIKVTEEI